MRPALERLGELADAAMEQLGNAAGVALATLFLLVPFVCGLALLYGALTVLAYCVEP